MIYDLLIFLLQSITESPTLEEWTGVHTLTNYLERGNIMSNSGNVANQATMARIAELEAMQAELKALKAQVKEHYSNEGKRKGRYLYLWSTADACHSVRWTVGEDY